MAVTVVPSTPRPAGAGSAVASPSKSLGVASEPPTAATSKVAAGSAPQPIALGVIVAVDGLSWDTLMRYKDLYQDGLKRLLSEGAVADKCRYLHLNTDTGAGHASLSTGTPPRLNGILGNAWFENGLVDKKDHPCHVYCVSAWNGSGENQRPNDCTSNKDPQDQKNWVIGPGNMRRDTIGDLLIRQQAGAKVVSLAGKDRSAILLAGRGLKDGKGPPEHAVYWYKRDAGTFVGSDYYKPATDDVARIVRDFNQARGGAALVERFGSVWKKSEALASLPARRPEFDLKRFAEVHDYQVPRLGIGFDHDMTKVTGGVFAAIHDSPMLDELLADLALVVLGDDRLKLGRRGVTDLLCLSFSSQDTVSHNYGSESEENLDVLLRLDAQLGRLLAAFDRLYPKGTVVLALSADHGFALIPELETKRKKRIVGGRLLASDRNPLLGSLNDRLNALLDEEFCLERTARPIAAMDGWSLYYENTKLLKTDTERACGASKRPPTVRDLDGAVTRLIARFYEPEIIKTVVRKSDHPCAGWKPGAPAKANDLDFICNDFDQARAGDIMLIAGPGVLIHWDPGRGSTHGSVYPYDTDVPLIFWGGPVKAGPIHDLTTPYDLAPTLADLMGVAMPPVEPARALSLRSGR